MLNSLRVQELASDSDSGSLSSTSPIISTADADSYYPYNPSNPYIPPPPPMPPAPPLFTNPPFLRDALTTRSSIEQDATVASCIRHLGYPEDPFPILDRENHIAFLESGLTSKLPDYMVAYDASRAWIVYWCLSGLASLGVDVTRYRTRVMDTLRPLQNASGGFGGGNGQMSHITATYAAVLSLCLVSPGASDDLEDSEKEEAPLDLVDRRAMLRYLHTVKVAETGGFRVAINGESDVRGCYCALVVITLLGLPTSGGLVRGTREYLSRCQTFEGGFGATPEGNEAHGGYAFCALAALCMLGEPREVLTRSLDMDRLISWLSARQYAPEGGLSGRTNKLVDGCYSTWVGGCWPLVEAACNGPQNPDELAGNVVGSLWSREGLSRYILTCCQSMRGGMRDKPNKYILPPITYSLSTQTNSICKTGHPTSTTPATYSSASAAHNTTRTTPSQRPCCPPPLMTTTNSPSAPHSPGVSAQRSRPSLRASSSPSWRTYLRGQTTSPRRAPSGIGSRRIIPSLTSRWSVWRRRSGGLRRRLGFDLMGMLACAAGGGGVYSIIISLFLLVLFPFFYLFFVSGWEGGFVVGVSAIGAWVWTGGRVGGSLFCCWACFAL